MKAKLIATICIACATGLAYSQVTPDSITYNIVGQPNMQTYYGKGKLAYYGSGDVTGNDTIDYRDLNALNSGILNNQGDINANNTPGDEEDKQILSEYINGERTHLPSQWNVLTREEKRDWALKTYNNVLRPSYITPYMPGWICSTYARQSFMENFGVTNVDEYISWLISGGEPELKNKEDVAKFNIPMYIATERMLNGTAHVINAVFIGKDLGFKVGEIYDINNFLFIDGKYGAEITPGSIFMSNTNNNITIKWEGYYHNPYDGDKFGSKDLLMFNLNDSVLTCTHIDPDLAEHLNTIKPKFTKKTDFVVPYDEFKEKGLETLVSESLPNDVHDDYDLSPTTDFSYVSGKTNEGSCSDYTFDIDIEFKAKNRFNKEETNLYTIQVKDEVKPIFTSFPGDIELNSNQISGEIDPDETGYATATDNSEGIVDINYNYILTDENSLKKYYDNIITASDVCGNDTTRVQKVIVNKPDDVGIIDNPDDKCKLKIYPNPIESNATIEYNTNGRNSRISIYSMSGQNLENLILDRDRLEHDFSKYAPGVYIVKAYDNNQLVTYKLVIKKSL